MGMSISNVLTSNICCHATFHANINSRLILKLFPAIEMQNNTGDEGRENDEKLLNIIQDLAGKKECMRMKIEAAELANKKMNENLTKLQKDRQAVMAKRQLNKQRIDDLRRSKQHAESNKLRLTMELMRKDAVIKDVSKLEDSWFDIGAKMAQVESVNAELSKQLADAPWLPEKRAFMDELKKHKEEVAKVKGEITKVDALIVNRQQLLAKQEKLPFKKFCTALANFMDKSRQMMASTIREKNSKAKMQEAIKQANLKLKDKSAGAADNDNSVEAEDNMFVGDNGEKEPNAGQHGGEEQTQEQVAVQQPAGDVPVNESAEKEQNTGQDDEGMEMMEQQQQDQEEMPMEVETETEEIAVAGADDGRGQEPAIQVVAEVQKQQKVKQRAPAQDAGFSFFDEPTDPSENVLNVSKEGGGFLGDFFDTGGGGTKAGGKDSSFSFAFGEEGSVAGAGGEGANAGGKNSSFNFGGFGEGGGDGSVNGDNNNDFPFNFNSPQPPNQPKTAKDKSKEKDNFFPFNF